MVGKKLLHYEVLEPLGSGGMGEVFRARDTTLNREVAIKVLHAETAADPSRLARFEREAKLLAALNHANIATIHGLEVSDEGVQFITMELVEGESLARVLASRGRLDKVQALGIARQVADAMEAAHAKGIVHRDLKPSNVACTPEGKVKVLDFGLAKPLKSAVSEADLSHSPTISMQETRPGVIVGTAAYMSPEQARGRPVDERTDVWSFGCVLYEMLAGHKAFGADNLADALAEILHAEPRWSDLPSDVPAALQAVLVRCLHKEPERRYASGGALAKELAAVARESSETSSAHPLPDPASSTSDRGRYLQFAALAVAALALTVVGVLAFGGPGWPGAAPLTAESMEPLVTWPSMEHGVRISPDGRWVSFISDSEGSSGIWLRSLSGGAPRRISSDLEAPTGHVWSPDSTRIAYLTRQGDELVLRVIPMLGGAVETSVVYPGPIETGMDRWVGDSIYLQELLALVRFDVEAGTFDRFVQREPEDRFATSSVRPDGSLIAYSRVFEGQEDLWLSAPDGSGAERLTNDDARDYAPEWVGNDRIVFLSHRGGQSNLWQLSLRDREPRLLATIPEAIDGLRASLDGRTLVLEVLEISANISLIEAGNGKETVLTGDSLGEFWPDLSPDGGAVAFQRTKPVPVLGLGHLDAQIYLGAFDSNAISSERMVADDGFSPRFSADGEWLSYVVISPAGAEVQEPRIELMVLDIRTNRAASVTDRFRPPGRLQFPLDWSSANPTWAHTSPTLYFVATGEGGAAEIRAVRVPPAAGADPPELIVAAETRRERLEDLHISSDDGVLLYTKDYRDGRREIRRRDLSTGEESVLFADDGADYLHFKGWLRDGSAIVLRSMRNTDETQRVEIFAVRPDGERERLDEVDHTDGPRAALDAEAGELYLIRTESGIHSLHAYSFADGSMRSVVTNTRPNASFAGMRPVAGRRLLFSRHERSRDLWLVRLGQ